MSEYEKTLEIAKKLYDSYVGNMKEALAMAIEIRRNELIQEIANTLHKRL